MTTTALPPAGWYSDPWRVTRWRWWDGATWTGYTDQYYPPLPPAYPPPVGFAVEPDRTRPIRAGWTAVLGMVVGVALTVAVYVVGFSLGVSTSSPLLLLAAQLGLWSGLLGACLVAVRRHGTGSLRDLGLRIRGIDVPLGIGFGIACLIGVGVIAQVLIALGIQPHRSSIVGPVERGPLTVVVLLLVTVVGAPFFEELFFRGLLMSGLVARFGAVLGVILQATVFGLVHLTPNADATGNLGVFLLIAPVGAVLGILRLGYKRLGTGMMTHAVYNAIVVTVLLTTR